MPFSVQGGTSVPIYVFLPDATTARQLAAKGRVIRRLKLRLTKRNRRIEKQDSLIENLRLTLDQRDAELAVLREAYDYLRETQRCRDCGGPVAP